MWNTINGRYSFFLYTETKPHFLILPLFKTFFSMTVWNTIDDRYSKFVLYKETKQHFLIFGSFQSVFSMTMWNTIDDRYSNYVSYPEMYQHFLVLDSLQSICSMQVCKCGILSVIDTSFLSYIYGFKMIEISRIKSSTVQNNIH